MDRARTLLLSLLLVLFGATAAGCLAPREVVVPLAMLTDTLPGATPGSEASRALIVFLPGAREVPRDIVDRGFVRMVRERKIAADVTVVDSHFGYFRDGSIVERLRADVIEPARRKGYASIWLAGISLGGAGSLGYAASRPGDVDGIIAMAPYVTSRERVEEIVAAGGLAAWVRSGALPKPGVDLEHRLLTWLAGYADPREKRPPLLLGWGESDSLAPSNRMVADVLPAKDVRVVPGGHDWRAWDALWAMFLDTAPLPRGCRAPGAAGC